MSFHPRIDYAAALIAPARCNAHCLRGRAETRAAYCLAGKRSMRRAASSAASVQAARAANEAAIRLP